MRGVGVCVLSALILVGCGRSDDTDGGDAGDAADAPPSAQLVFRAGEGPIAKLDFAGVVIGGVDAIDVVMANEGDAATGVVELEIDGDFRTDGDCDGAVLDPGASCRVRVTFAPEDPGPRSGELRAIAGDVEGVLGLAGSGVLVEGIVVDPAGFDYGLVEVGTTATFAFRVLNPGIEATTDVGVAVDAPGLRVAATSCGAALESGMECDVSVEVAPSAIGSLAGLLTVTSSLGAAQASLAATGAGRVTVSMSGEGAGVIASDPPGIDCGASCTGLFVEPVTLTAASGTGSAFAGWDGECGAAASCEVAVSPEPTSLGATFDLDPAFRRIALAFTGDAPGEVGWRSGDLGGACTGSCKIVVPFGATVVLRALTPATFGGWTDLCEREDPRCEVILGASIDRSVGFLADDAAGPPVRLPVEARGLALHPGGHLLVGDGSHVTRVTESGQMVWTTALEHPARDIGRLVGLDVSPAGEIYALTESLDGLHLHRLRGTDGGLEWSAALPGLETGSDKDFSAYLAVTGSGRAAVLGLASDGAVLRLYNASGTVSWTATGLPFPRALAISPLDVLHAAVESSLDPDFTQIRRFDLEGSEQAGITLLPGFYSTSLAVDVDGFVAASTFGHDDVTVSRLSPDGEPVFEDLVNLAGLVDHAVRIDSEGNVIAIRDRDSFATFPGYHLRQLSPSGALVWEIDKPGQEGLDGDAGAEPVGLATRSDGRIAVAYAFSAIALGGHWVTIYQP